LLGTNVSMSGSPSHAAGSETPSTEAELQALKNQVGR
jgi:hypothetical protein